MATERNLTDQVALVTGASRGIGLAIALELGRRGAFVIGTATTEQGAQKIGQALEGGTQGVGECVVIQDGASVDALFARLADRQQTPSILVNNAGVTRDNLLARMKDDEWSDVIDVNLSGMFRLTRAVMRPMMKARFGRIVNLTSVVGAAGNAGQSNYAAAKAGIIGFSRSIAKEVASRGITVNSVAPGFIDTDMTRALSDAQRAAVLDTIPAGRLGEADEIARAVAFLASPDSGYITGTTLHVNGGMYMG
ncbi:MAG: 3-oxoacyl-ACP reductase FabG [Gammaproteobacteria bacterium]|nr:3-oxoacyl-ACP reductase FabG [Gammaproteobacteria bacterium]